MSPFNLSKQMSAYLYPYNMYILISSVLPKPINRYYSQQEPAKVSKPYDFIQEVRPVDEGKNVKHCSDIGVVVARGLLQVLQRLFTQRHRHLVSALRSILNHQVVQGSEPSWNLIASLLSGCYSTAVWGLDYREKDGQRQIVQILSKSKQGVCFTLESEYCIPYTQCSVRVTLISYHIILPEMQSIL